MAFTAGMAGIEQRSSAARSPRRARRRIARDALPVPDEGPSEVTKAVWDFYPSPVTGKVGPTEELRKLLKERKIEIKIHDHI